MNTIKSLEAYLQREMPTFHWQCTPSDFPKPVSGLDIPEEIEIHATRDGAEVVGSPLFLNGNLLARWGLEPTARLVNRHFVPPFQPAPSWRGVEWDKLADL